MSNCTVEIRVRIGECCVKYRGKEVKYENAFL